MRLVRVHADLDREGFVCGEATLEDFIRFRALQFSRRNLAQTFVLTADGREIIGYFSIAATGVEYESIADGVRKGKPSFNLPGALLARLAIAEAWQGRGLGKQLLGLAIDRVGSISDEIGIAVLVVDALHDHAVAFY